MRRRDLIAATGASAALALAGCTGSPTSDGDGSPTGTADGGPSPTGSSLPDGIYVQPFSEMAAMQGMARAGDYAVALMYAAPHRFWNVNGESVQETPREGDLHLMATVWDPESGTVLPETGLSVTIRRGDGLVSEEVIYPMLSQRMGFHYGANFGLDGDGTYAVTVDVGAMSIPRTGSFAGRFDGPASVEIDLAFTPEEREKVASEPLDAHGQPGAVKPMDMEMVPQALAPPSDRLPGRVLGEKHTDGARLTTTALTGDAASRFGGDGYLAVSPRTRYNGLALPALGLSATVTRGGETVFDGSLQRKLDTELGYHYGASVAVESGDEVRVEPTLPAQVARHEGYERAFLQMEPVTYAARFR